MVCVIAFISQKGGVGKSTVARALAREGVSNGLKVKVADLDNQQGTTAEWSRRRLNRGIGPEVPVQNYGTAKDALKDVTRGGYDLLIIDGPARTSEATKKIAEAADLVVQPTGSSLDDLLPGVKEFHALIKAGIPRERLAFALNRIGTEAEEASARDYLAQAGYAVLDGCLPERPAYRLAQNEGRAITETRFQALNERADALVQSLVDRIK